MYITILKIVLGAIIGTSLMTAFSYYLSYKLNRQFKEPRLLNRLLKRSTLFKGKQVPPISGWLIHYSVGFILIIMYHFIWTYTQFNPSLLTGGVLGLLSGPVGVTIWSFVFNIHSNPPSIDFKKYYLQLGIAHIVFGIFGTAGYMIF